MTGDLSEKERGDISANLSTKERCIKQLSMLRVKPVGRDLDS